MSTACAVGLLLARGGTRPSYARLPHMEDGSAGASTRVGDCSPLFAQESGDSLSNIEDARRGTNRTNDQSHL